MRNSEKFIYLVLLLIVIIYAYIGYLINKKIVELIVIVLFIILFLTSWYAINLYKMAKFKKIVNQIKLSYVNVNTTESVILIKNKSFKMKPINKSWDVPIAQKFVKTTAIYCTTDNFIVIFIIKPQFIFLKEYCNPILFSKFKLRDEIETQVKKIEIFETEIIENEIIIKSREFPNEINEIKLNHHFLSPFLWQKK
jgi:hypothetical protein